MDPERPRRGPACSPWAWCVARHRSAMSRASLSEALNPDRPTFAKMEAAIESATASGIEFFIAEMPEVTRDEVEATVEAMCPGPAARKDLSATG